MGDNKFKYTQCIIIRSDLKMSKGKLAVQAAHASVGALLHTDFITGEAWFLEGQRKIALKTPTEQHLNIVYEHAAKFEIPAYIVTDLGLTEFTQPTVTCLGLGPCTIEQMDKLTNGMELF